MTLSSKKEPQLRSISQTSDFCLSETEQEELDLAVAEIRRGEYTDGRELLKELKGLAGRVPEVRVHPRHP